jgi:hypothetical protein
MRRLLQCTCPDRDPEERSTFNVAPTAMPICGGERLFGSVGGLSPHRWRKSLYWKLRRKTTATAACNGLPPLASVGVSIKFVVRWLTDILDVLHHDDCPAGDPPYPKSPQTPATMFERVIKGIIEVRCLKVRARKSSCKK